MESQDRADFLIKAGAGSGAFRGFQHGLLLVSTLDTRTGFQVHELIRIGGPGEGCDHGIAEWRPLPA